MNIKLLFSTRKRNPFSTLIRTITWSEWSHVEIVLPNRMLIGANAPDGISINSIDHRLEKSSAAAYMTVECNADNAILWSYSQLNKPYDWLGVIGLGINRDWQEDDAWFCSEFVGKALMVGGYSPYDGYVIRRLTPQHLWMLNLPRDKIK